MERRLRRDGYGVISLDLGGLLWRYNTKSIDHQENLLLPKWRVFALNIIWNTFILLVIQWGDLLQDNTFGFYGGSERVKSLITLGTPHHGTPLLLSVLD